MADPKILNLDDVGAAEPGLVIKLDQEDHPLSEMTVEGYITRVKRAETLRARTEQSPEDQVENMIAFINDSFPTISIERLRKLKLAQLNAIINFAIATPKDIAEKVESEQEGTQAGNA